MIKIREKSSYKKAALFLFNFRIAKSKVVMKLETGYDIGNNVYYMKNNRIDSDNIFKIRVVIERLKDLNNIQIRYSLYKNPDTWLVAQELFKTKEELLASL